MNSGLTLTRNRGQTTVSLNILHIDHWFIGINNPVDAAET